MLFRSYAHFAACRAVAPAIYDAWAACADNLTNGSLLDVVADCCGRDLVRAAPQAADNADVSDLDQDILDLFELWLESDFQDWIIRRIAPSAQRALPPEWGAGLMEAFHDVGPGALGFNPARGLDGRKALKVHLVGHTHEPATTTPPLAGKLVPAQHVNTGTGQDTWLPDDTFGVDHADRGNFSVEWSRDSLTPVPRSQYAIVTLAPDPADGRMRLHVEGGKYRSLQAGNPRNVKTTAIYGGLSPAGANRLDL